MSLTAREHLASATMIANHELLTHLEHTQAALESLVRGMQDFICLATVEGRVLWGNEKAARWLSCDTDSLHRQHLSHLLEGDAWLDFLAYLLLEAVPGGDDQFLEFQTDLQLEGRTRQILWSVRPFREISQRRGRVLLLSGRDITEVLAEKQARTRLESELETAQLVQSAFFPPMHIERPALAIGAYYRPAEKCSGDWWGHFPLSETLDLLCIADVSGHGAPSALVTAMTQATCMNFAHRFRSGLEAEVTPTVLLEQLNRVIYDTFHGSTYMTFFVLLFDTQAGAVMACNAAHNFPFVLRRQESLEGSQGYQRAWPEPLMLGGNPLGSEAAPDYAVKSWPLGTCDRFVLFTDGLIECRNPQGKSFGSSGLRRSMIKHKELGTLAFRDAVISDALAHYDSCPLGDDVSLLVIDLLR